jgi:hypothetical protein
VRHDHVARSPARRPPSPAPLHEENVKLVGRVLQLRRGLEAAARENGQLRRELARARAENSALRSGSDSRTSLTPAGADRRDREACVRVMLTDPHSRNP